MKTVKTIIITLLVLVGLTQNVWAAPTASLDEYLIFAISDFVFKGKNSQGGNLLGGHIGVNALTPGNNNPVMRIGEVFMDPGTYAVADSLRINQDDGVMGDIYTNQLFGTATFTLLGTQSTFTPPVFNPFPTLFTAFSAGTTDVDVPNGTTLDLAPGIYGSLEVHDNATLRLGPGIYTFEYVNIAKKVKVYTTPGTIVQIAGATDPNKNDFHMNEQSYVGSEDPNIESIALFRIQGDSVRFGHQGEFWGVVLAPDAHVDLGGNWDHYGRYVVDSVSSDFNSNVYYRNYVPEPASLFLLGGSFFAALFRRRKS